MSTIAQRCGALFPLLLLLAAGQSPHAKAQVNGDFRTKERSFALELVRPSFGGEGFQIISGLANFTARLPAGDHRMIVIEVPLAHGSLDREFANSASTTLGNPYVGIEIGNDTNSAVAVLGARIPIGQEWGDDDFATGLGIVSDMNRMPAFLTEYLTLDVGGRGRIQAEESPMRGGILGTVSGMIPTADNGDFEVLVNGGVHLGYYEPRWWLSTGVSGIWLASEPDADFSDVSTFEIGFTGGLDRGSLRPMVNVRVPLDEGLFFRQDYSIGFGLQWVPGDGA